MLRNFLQRKNKEIKNFLQRKRTEKENGKNGRGKDWNARTGVLNGLGTFTQFFLYIGLAPDVQKGCPFIEHVRYLIAMDIVNFEC